MGECAHLNCSRFSECSDCWSLAVGFVQIMRRSVCPTDPASTVVFPAWSFGEGWPPGSVVYAELVKSFDADQYPVYEMYFSDGGCGCGGYVVLPGNRSGNILGGYPYKIAVDLFVASETFSWGQVKALSDERAAACSGADGHVCLGAAPGRWWYRPTRSGGIRCILRCFHARPGLHRDRAHCQPRPQHRHARRAQPAPSGWSECREGYSEFTNSKWTNLEGRFGFLACVMPSPILIL